MRPVLFLALVIALTAASGCEDGALVTLKTKRGGSCTSNDLTNFMQFMREPQHLSHSTDSHHERMEAATAQLHGRDSRNVTSLLLTLPMLTLDDGNLMFWAEDPAFVREHHDTRDSIAAYTLLVLILMALSPIAFYDSWHSFAVVMVYLVSVALVKVFVKEAITQGFEYSETITALHMIGVSVVILCFERPRMAEALPVLPVSVLNGASILTNNKAFLYGGVAFVSMVGANSPFVTFCLEVCKGKRQSALLSIFAVSLVCSGSVCCVHGETRASLAALILALASTVLRSARGVWQHELVSVSPAPLHLVFWNVSWTLVMALVSMTFSEGLDGIRSLSTASFEAKAALFCSIVSAVLLNITQWFAMKALGALMASIVGNLNLVLVIALSSAWLHEHVSLWQCGGVALLCAGTFVNKVQDVLRHTAAREHAADGAARSTFKPS
eukprot:s1851_g19.t1